jgi:hypothetical protein
MAVPARRVRMGRRPDPVRLSEDGRERRDNGDRLKSPQQASVFWTPDAGARSRTVAAVARARLVGASAFCFLGRFGTEVMTASKG